MTGSYAGAKAQRSPTPLTNRSLQGKAMRLKERFEFFCLCLVIAGVVVAMIIYFTITESTDE